jgi:hypothetical protein
MTHEDTEMISWREGSPHNERAVNCCNCGATIAVAESRVAGPKDDAIFSCSHVGEQEYEEREVLPIAAVLGHPVPRPYSNTLLEDCLMSKPVFAARLIRVAKLVHGA